MSHPAENVTSDRRESVTLTHEVFCGSTLLTTCTGARLSGEYETRTRSGSHNNPPNADGWRYPSNYYATKNVAMMGGRYFIRIGPFGGYSTGCYSAGLPRQRYDNYEATAPDYVTPSVPPWPSGWVDYAKDICITNAINDLEDRKIDLGQTLAEMQQTVDMIADAGRALADLAKCVRRRQCGPLKSRLGKTDFGNLWLQYRYGWSPLVSDIYGLYKTIKGIVEKDYERLYLKGRAKLGDDARDFHPDTGWGGSPALSFPSPISCTNGNPYSAYATCSCEMRTVYSGKYFAKYRIDARLTKPDVYTWLSNSTVSDPVTLMWELLPYSFVADWFANIGDWLDSLNAYDGLTPLSGCFTYGRELTMNVELRPRVGWSNTKYVQTFQQNTPVSRKYFEFTRYVEPAPVRGYFRFLRNPLNLTRLFDSIALVNQAIKRH